MLGVELRCSYDYPIMSVLGEAYRSRPSHPRVTCRSLGSQYKEFNQMAAAIKETMHIADGHLFIVKKLAPRPSKAGKSMLLVSTNGRQSFSHEGKDVQVNLNAYVLND